MPKGSSRAGFFFVVCAIAIGQASVAGAATVANTNDSGPGSLRATIVAAAPGETITLPAGTYSLTSGELPIAKNLAIAGAGAGATAIRAAASGFRLIGITGPNVAVTIADVTLRDASLGFGGIKQGGAILNQEASLTLRGVVITNNVADASSPGNGGGIAEGGGIASEGSAAHLTIVDSTISGNTARTTGASGKTGGIAEGGGIWVEGGGFSISGSTISGNVADSRGGQGPSSPSQSGGIAEGAGFEQLSGAATPSSLQDTTISGNVTDASGGPGSSNGIAEGGGVALLNSKGAVSFSAATFSGNLARANGSGTTATGIAEGGGIYASVGAPSTLTITAATIAANSVESPSTSSGGNLYGGPGTTMANSIVSGGRGAPGEENCRVAQLPLSSGFNLDSGDQCGFHSIGDKVNTDPQLGPLQGNGGPTQTMLPAATSPVVDQGAGFGLSSDQRGIVRPIDFPSIPNSAAPGANGSDIGAVELQPSNAFSIGKLKKNKKKGTALLTVNLPSPNVGGLSLSGKGLKPRTATVDGSKTTYTFVVATKGATRKALRKRGKRKVAINVTYAPAGNSPLTVARKAKLVLKHGHSRHKAHRH